MLMASNVYSPGYNRVWPNRLYFRACLSNTPALTLLFQLLYMLVIITHCAQTRKRHMPSG